MDKNVNDLFSDMWQQRKEKIKIEVQEISNKTALVDIVWIYSRLTKNSCI